MAKKKSETAATPVTAGDGQAPTDQQSVAAPPSVAPAPAPVPKDTQNGVTRPKEGTVTGRVWAIADSISQASQKPAERATVFEACEKEGINKATTATQFGLWRAYHGLVNKRGPRQPKAPAVAAPDPAAGAAASAETGQSAAVE